MLTRVPTAIETFQLCQMGSRLAHTASSLICELHSSALMFSLHALNGLTGIG